MSRAPLIRPFTIAQSSSALNGAGLGHQSQLTLDQLFPAQGFSNYQGSPIVQQEQINYHQQVNFLSIIRLIIQKIDI